MTTIRILGEEELKRCLNNLPYQLKKRLVISSLRTAAMPMKKQAVENAPRRKGTIKNSIVTVDAKEDVPQVMIAPRQGKKQKYDAWYAKFQEFGTKGFGKRKRRVTGIRVNLKTGSVYKSRVTTAWAKKGVGLPAQEFMQRAFESKKDEVLSSIHKVLNKKVVTYLQRNAPKYYAQ